MSRHLSSAAPAGGRAAAGLLADGLAGGGGWLEAYAAGWRMMSFLGAGDARRKRDAAGAGGAVGGVQCGGAMVCRGWLGGGDPEAIRRYLSDC